MLPPLIGLGVVWFGQYALGAFGGFTVNIFLIPYTWFRHLAMAFWCAAWGLAGWAVVLTIFVKMSPGWHPAMDGSILVSTLAGVVAFASILGEAGRGHLPEFVARPALHFSPSGYDLALVDDRTALFSTSRH